MGWVLLLFPEARSALLWLLAGGAVAVLFMAPLIGMFVQPWAPFWLAGATVSPPGIVPIQPPPQGPLPGEDSRLMLAVQPWMQRPTPYLFGGCSLTGVDCSCFVQLVFRSVGISLPRTAQQQYNATERVTEPHVGDLVFFQGTYQSPDRVTHVGIMVADGLMISAAEPAVGRQSLASPFWRAHLYGWGRVHRS